MAINIGRPFDLVRAERYTDPDDPAQIIPDVYGDFTEGGLAGPCPAYRIDQATNVYAAAAHAIESITKVYIGPVLQSSGYTVNVANNYQSQGTIATITFSSQPADVVSWRGKGKQSGGVLITNCVRQIADLLNERAGFPSSILDFWSGAINFLDGLDYRTAWVVGDERDIAEWLQEMVFNMSGQLFLWGHDEIGIDTDIGTIGNPIPLSAKPPIAHIVASRDVQDGDDGVEMFALYEHLVNAMDLYYLWNWVGGNASSRIVTTGDEDRRAKISQNAYGEIRKSVTLRGIRRQQDLNWFATTTYAKQSMFDRFAGVRVRFTVEGPRIAHATIGDLFGFSWKFGPTLPGGQEYRNRLHRVIGVNIDPMRGGRTVITSVDMGQSTNPDDPTAVLL